MTKTVRIVAPVRNREWILPIYLRHLEALEYPSQALSFHFIANDCTDNTKGILYEFKHAWEGYGTHVEDSVCVDQVNFHRVEQDTRVDSVRQRTYPILANLRNALFEKAVHDGVDYVLSVDTDILVPPDLLQRLLAHQKDVVAALISNGIGAHNYLLRSLSGGLVKDPNPPVELFQVALTGAVCLYSRYACEIGRFRADKLGEDAGFANSLVGHDISMWVDGTLHCRHIMRPEDMP